MKRVFISIPMTGCMEQSRKLYNETKESLSKIWGNVEFISGFDVYDREPDKDDPYYIGKDVEELLHCNAVIFMVDKDYNSKGCKVERLVAELYQIKSFEYEKDILPLINKSKINYVIGDATKPTVKENEYSVICHCCNALGVWGAGFVIPLGNTYPKAKQGYLDFINKTESNDRLGKVNYVKVTSNIVVANIIGQYSTGITDGKIPLDYDALEKGFNNVIENFTKNNMPFSIHMPRIGCGLAGGDWKVVENIITNTFINNGISVTVYDLVK